MKKEVRLFYLFIFILIFSIFYSNNVNAVPECTIDSQCDKPGCYKGDCITFNNPDFNYCTSSYSCSSSQYCSGSSCLSCPSSECTPFSDRCNGNSVESCESKILPSLTCPQAGEWKYKYSCSSDETCSNGQCVCKSECTIGTTECSSPTTEKYCKNVGGCGKWETRSCPSNVCSAGKCISCTNECTSGQKKCSDSKTVQTCGNYDADTCIEWGSTQACPVGQLCSNGACYTPCTNECTSGQKKCSDSKTVQTCGNYDADTCTEWGSNQCPLELSVCKDGNCVCKDGDKKSCYTGIQGTEGIGICKSGTATCSSGNYGACTGQVLPQAEICTDNLDNDCDGSTDKADSDCQCNLESVNLNNECSGLNSNKCEQNENINVKADYSGTYCPKINKLQVDASDSANNCKIQFIDGEISGITTDTGTLLVSGEINKNWKIPSVPAACCGKDINPNSAGLWIGNPGSGEILSSTSSVSGSFKFSGGSSSTCKSDSDCCSGLSCLNGKCACPYQTQVALKCSVKSACLSDENYILSLYSSSDSHVSLDESAPLKLCCSGVENSCTSNNVLLKLYANQDGHVSVNNLNYPNQICLSSFGSNSDNVDTECRTIDSGSCDSDEQCVLTLSSSDDAHVAKCGISNSYDKKICCKNTLKVCCPANFIYNSRTSQCEPVFAACYIGDSSGNYISEQCKSRWRDPYTSSTSNFKQDQPYWKDAVSGNLNQDCFNSQTIPRINKYACCLDTVYNNKEYGKYQEINPKKKTILEISNDLGSKLVAS